VHFTRTARRLFDGIAYVRRSRLEAPAEQSTSIGTGAVAKLP